MAPYDRCEPRFVTVQINKYVKDIENNVVLWPPCTRIERCAGCCATDSLVCEPVEGTTELITLKVKILKIPNLSGK